MILLFIVIKRF